MSASYEAFQNLVALRYKAYNSIFLTLELDGVHHTGIMLPILHEYCKHGFEQSKNPQEIIDSFFDEQIKPKSEKAKLDMLFRFIQFIERQVVLVDALEDASFDKVNDTKGSGSYKAFYETVSNRHALAKLKDALKLMRVRIVLTAHPTQFYPGAVLGIINDLADAIENNQLLEIKKLLEQLGRTPFFPKRKPTPYDEAVSLIWYLENIFYHAIPWIYEEVLNSIGDTEFTNIVKDSPILQLGFWPGGDRDGNPYVSVDTTLAVADRLRTSLLKCYFRDIRALKRRITFKGLDDIISKIEQRLYQASYMNPSKPEITYDWFSEQLNTLISDLEKDYNGLYVNEVRKLKHKLKIFGFHFSTIDIRQDSGVISETMQAIIKKYPTLFPKNYQNISDNKKADFLFNIEGKISPDDFKDPITKDTIASFYAIRKVKEKNGEDAAYRYIISNCSSVLDLANVFGLARLCGWKYPMYLDIIPLFETIDDLDGADDTMDQLYSIPEYKKHLKNRRLKQVVMLGFSDGTKDGGYLTANWSIYKSKEMLTKVSKKHGIRIVFFDGRGGPPARGGGNTHKFYASLGHKIESSQIQLTIQGQTISSNYGTIESSKFNLEQLLTAGLENIIFDDPETQLNRSERKLLEKLSEYSYKEYKKFKKDPRFIAYLQKMSPMKYFSAANIGSRPSKRGKTKKLTLSDLRAIPFVGAWGQLKQNVPGFFGIGTSFKKLDQEGKIKDVCALYRNSLFFRTLVENSMQSLSKTFFPLTAYMEHDKEFGEFWQWIYKEYKLSKEYLLKVSGQDQLLQTNPSIRDSIKLREEIVLPLLTIQQYALMKLKEESDHTNKYSETYKKLVIRSMYGNINAARNSA